MCYFWASALDFSLVSLKLKPQSTPKLPLYQPNQVQNHLWISELVLCHDTNSANSN